MDSRTLFYGIMAILAWGLWGVLIKYATMRGMTGVAVYIVASLAPFLVIPWIYLAYKPKILIGISLLVILTAGVFGTLGYLFVIKALEKASAGTIIAMTSIYPAVTFILSYIFLGEQADPKKIAGILLALTGVILLSLE
ncbi:MAG: DMT family transporter [Desulfurococcales archaeon]|nr:DMT family transporter [Desulfurococcales archaeon]